MRGAALPGAPVFLEFSVLLGLFCPCAENWLKPRVWVCRGLLFCPRFLDWDQSGLESSMNSRQEEFWLPPPHPCLARLSGGSFRAQKAEGWAPMHPMRMEALFQVQLGASGWDESRGKKKKRSWQLSPEERDGEWCQSLAWHGEAGGSLWTLPLNKGPRQNCTGLWNLPLSPKLPQPGGSLVVSSFQAFFLAKDE